MRVRALNVVANNPVLYFLGGLVVTGFVFVYFWVRSPGEGRDLVVEGFGFLLDIMLFGVLLSLYDKWRERRRRVRQYHDELSDFHFWKEEEGVLRKVGIIRRLNEMHAWLPSMETIVLRGAVLWNADLRGADLQGAYLQGAYLQGAKLGGAYLMNSRLEGADLTAADLEGANLKGAVLFGTQLLRANLEEADLRRVKTWSVTEPATNLEGAKLRGANLCGADLCEVQGLTWDQLKEARLDDKTKLPDYLKKDDPRKQTGETE